MLLRQNCHIRGKQVENLLENLGESPIPIKNFFPIAFNQSTLLLEILTYYANIWSKTSVEVTEKELERSRKENWQRCNQLFRDLLFVMIMSTIEYSAKLTVEYYGDHPIAKRLRQTKRNDLYLSDIMRNSHSENLLLDNVYDEWSTLINVRNCIVHNNSISHRNKNTSIGKLLIEEKKNEMLQGKMHLFLSLSEIACDKYFDWTMLIIRKCSD